MAYNTDTNREPVTDLRIDAYYIDGGATWIAETDMDEAHITQAGQTSSEAIDKLLCSLEALGFVGTVDAPVVGQPDHVDDRQFYQLGA